jgi:long-chain fatty acid transport protein
MKKLIVRFLALSLPATVLANGYDVPNVNPRDLAVGSSFVAAQEDAGATYVNPAALARLDGLSLNLGGSILDNRTTWNAPAGSGLAGSPTDTKVSVVLPVSLFASYSGDVLGHGVGVGVGFNVPAGAHVFWPDGWAGRERIIKVDRRIYAFYASAGLEIVKQLRIGGGLIVYRGVEDLLLGIGPGTGTARLSAAGNKTAFDLSAEFTPFENVPLTFAVDYKHQALINLTGSAHFDVVPTLQGTLQDQGASHVLPYPTQFHAAVAYKLIPPLTLGFTYTLSRYAIYGEDLFQPTKSLPAAIVVPRNYGNGYTLRFGAEWVATRRLTLRAGFERDISGMPKVSGASPLTSPTYSPTLPDSNTWIGAVGLGWKFARNFSVNASFFYAKMDDVQSTATQNLPGGPFPGLYQTHVFVYSLGFVYGWMPGQEGGVIRPL